LESARSCCRVRQGNDGRTGTIAYKACEHLADNVYRTVRAPPVGRTLRVQQSIASSELESKESISSVSACHTIIITARCFAEGYCAMGNRGAGYFRWTLDWTTGCLLAYYHFRTVPSTRVARAAAAILLSSTARALFLSSSTRKKFKRQTAIKTGNLLPKRLSHNGGEKNFSPPVPNFNSPHRGENFSLAWDDAMQINSVTGAAVPPIFNYLLGSMTHMAPSDSCSLISDINSFTYLPCSAEYWTGVLGKILSVLEQ